MKKKLYEFNSNEYTKLSWALKRSEENKIECMDRTSTMIQKIIRSSSMSCTFRGTNVQIEPHDFCFDAARVVIDEKIDLDTCGALYPDENIIGINRLILSSGRLSCETVAHESVHRIQHEIGADAKSNSRKAPLQSISTSDEYKTMLKCCAPDAAENFKAFGIDVCGSLYIDNGDIEHWYANKVAHILYPLCAIERHALLTADRIISSIDDDRLSKKPHIEHFSYGIQKLAIATMDFQELYNCKDLSCEQIYMLCDNVQTYLMFGYGITTDLEANVAYDMVALLEYKNSPERNLDALYRLSHRLALKEKEIALAKDGYVAIGSKMQTIGDYVYANYLPMNSINSIDHLRALPPSEQAANPKAIAEFAVEKELDPRPYLHDVKAFDSWLFSAESLAVLTNEVQGELSLYMGEQYSINARMKKIEKRESVINDRKRSDYAIALDHNYKDIGYLFDDFDRQQ